MSMPSLPSNFSTFSDRRRRAHLIAGTCVVGIVYTALVLFVRLVLL